MTTSPRIIFLGTPEFAVTTLDAIIKANYTVVAVITAPDKPAGRGQVVTESAVKQYAVANNIPVLQPEKLKNEDFINELKTYKADLQIVVAFRMLPEVVWNMPAMGTVNLHASLLPHYRGAAPINWAVINGEQQSGITTFKLQHQIDTGNILLSQAVPITPNMNAGELHDTLMHLGGELIVKTIDGLIHNTIVEQPQATIVNESELKHAPKLFKDNTKIDWTTTAQHIHNVVRGLSPYPTAHTVLVDENGIETSMKIFTTTLIDTHTTSSIVSINTDGKTYFNIHTSHGIIGINSLQLAGKKRMNTPDFLRGYKLTNNYTLR
jgi:methionyl-tRNA formyltransferase